MAQLSPDRFYAEIETSAARLAALVTEQDPGLAIPTCPDWTLRQLAAHVGRVHRWAAEVVSTRAAEAIPMGSVPDGKFPDDLGERAAWLTAGAARVVAAIQSAGSDQVWAFGDLAPATFWARRQSHETMVHRADAEIAAGQPPVFDPELAADAIDEWLAIATRGARREPDPRAAASPAGTTLHVHATDDGLDGRGEWIIRRGSGGVTVEPGHAKSDAAVTGPASILLLVLLRRLPATDPSVTVHGDPGILESWLASTPF